MKKLNGTTFATWNTKGIGSVSRSEVAYGKFTTTEANATSLVAYPETGFFTGDSAFRWWLGSTILNNTYGIFYVAEGGFSENGRNT